MGVEQKIVLLKHFKRSFDASRKKAADPIEWLEALPPNPFDAQQSHSLLWSSVYGTSGGPTPAPVELKDFMKDVQALDMSFGCRGGRAKQPQCSTAMVAAESPQSLSVERLVSTLMATQSKMLEMYLGSGGAAGSCVQLTGAASALHRRARTVDFDDEVEIHMLPRQGRLRVTDESSDQPGTAMVLAPAVAPATVIAETASSSPSGSQRGALGDVDDMLKMLESRRNTKKMKAEAGVSAQGEVAATTPLKVTPKRKATSPSPSPAVIDAKSVTATAVTPCAKSKAKSKAKPKAKPKATPKAKPARMVSDASEGVGDAKVAGSDSAMGGDQGEATHSMHEKVELIVGCSKCRGKGCTQCRSPNFSGKRYSAKPKRAESKRAESK